MKEISMHILDIVMNSINAKATLVEVCIVDSKKINRLKISIKDNGVGMSSEMVKKAEDTFFTTRTTRKVGLGIPMFKESCERCNGSFNIQSKIGEGTLVECTYERDNIDRIPLGNMGDTIMAIIVSLRNCELLYTHITDIGTFILNTSQIRELLGERSIEDNEILLWIREYVNENIQTITFI